MIDLEGYPRLIDFGVAKIIKGRTFTIVGTPHYMAPEMIKGKGYGIDADYWSLGVMLYECICGYLPFAEGETNPLEIYHQILTSELTFPADLPQFPAKRFIERLLNKSDVPAMRSGCRKGPLKSEPWLAEVNWDEVVCKRLTPPYIPSNNIDSNEIRRAIQKNIPADVTIAKQEAKEPLSEPDVGQENWDADF